MLLLHTLFLSIILKASTLETDGIDSLVLIEFTEPLPPDFLITHEKSTNTENFAVADFEQSNESTRELRIQLHNIYQVAALDKPCSLTESIRQETTNASVTALHRLKDNKVVVVWHDETKDNVNRRTRVVVVHLESCIVINRDFNQLRGNPIVVPRDDGNFDIFVDDEVVCGSAQCVISYDLKLDEYSQPKPFEVELEWPNLKIDRLSDGNLVIRGFKNSVYKVMLMNGSTGQTKLLMSILAVNPRLEFLSSKLSFCWTMPSIDISVRCAQFNHLGDLIFSSTVKLDFGRKVTLIHVHDIGEGKIFLVVGTVACRIDYDCWNLSVAEVHQDQTLRLESTKFRCTGDRKKLRVFDVAAKNNVTAVRYACRFENGYAYYKSVVDASVVRDKELTMACQRYAGDVQLFCT